MEPSHAVLASGRCRVFALDVPLATGLELHGAYTPCEWPHNQFAADADLHHHLAQHGWQHPWLVSDAASADAIVITGHGFDRWCVAQTLLRNRILEAQTQYQNSELRDGNLCAGSSHVEACGAPHTAVCKRAGRLFRSEVAKRQLWERMHDAADALNSTAPRVVTNLNNECPPPWMGTKRSVPSDTIMLVDRARRAQDGVVPFVLSRPAWLLGDAPVPADFVPRAPWAMRTLLFFAGHVPKLYVSSTRYLLWRAWRRDPRVSVFTKDIACALTAHSICREPERWASEAATFCQRDCGTTRACKSGAAAMQRECKFYKKVPWDDELPDVARTNRALNRSAYLRAAMNHRYCVVAPGDYPSTPKITEFVAVGAAGGCLPVVVVPSPARDGARRQLPYASTWLDYCDIAFLIPESAVGNSSEMRVILDRLAAVSPAEAARKRRALRHVRDAFVTRPTATPDGAGARAARPTASDFLLHEACALARRRSATRVGVAGRNKGNRRHNLRATPLPLDRCLLAAEHRAPRGD